ncbi:MAG: hypothetical protein HS115_14610 [Spirochaetales bacterium]|nr:hypothetical protein [Spirochaetales bacterium]
MPGPVIFTIVVILSLALAGNLFADTVILKSGTVLEGQIVSQSQQQVQLKTERGTIRIQKGTIRRITFGPSPSQPEKPVALKQTEAVKPTVPAKPEPGIVAALKKPEEKTPALKKPVESPEKKSEKSERSEAAVTPARSRSADFLPGWPQYRRGDRNSGIALGAGTTAALGLALDSRTNFIIAGKSLQQAERTGLLALAFPGSALPLNLLARSQAARAIDRMQDSATRFNLGFLLFAGLYGYHLYDARRIPQKSVGSSWQMEWVLEKSGNRTEQTMQMGYR